MCTWRCASSHCSKTASGSVGAFGYDRERGRFKIFRAKAVVLATGGIGKAYKITSNSWDCTGDGHSLAYHAGAELIDMEYVQFHPTGMVWPPSVRGMLVTEGVRGEGGILTNNEGERFMFDFIPENYKAQTADNEEEGWRYTQGDKNARRPPELLTRDHVARCIVREIKEGRGTAARRRLSRHFLDQDKSCRTRRSTSSASCRACITSSKQLGDIDITKEPMEVGPDHALHHGRRARRCRHPDVETCPACSPRANAPPELTARTGSAAIRSPIFWFSGNGPANSRRNSRKENSLGKIDNDQVETSAREALKPFENSRAAKIRTRCSAICRR